MEFEQILAKNSQNRRNPQKQLFLAKLLEIPKPYTSRFFTKPGYPPGKNQKSPKNAKNELKKWFFRSKTWHLGVPPPNRCIWVSFWWQDLTFSVFLCSTNRKKEIFAFFCQKQLKNTKKNIKNPYLGDGSPRRIKKFQCKFPLYIRI